MSEPAFENKGTADAAYNLIENNYNLVHYCCHKLKGRGVEYDDLFQAGCLGLIKAAHAFDPSRGLCFSTYAVPVILGEIKRLFRDGGAIKVGRALKSLSLKTADCSRRLSNKLGREPTVNEIADELSVSPEEVAEALCAGRPVLSLTAGEEDDGHEHDIPVKGSEDELCDRLALTQALKKIDDRSREVIRLRYFEHNTQSVAAQKLGMTQVQVSRAEKRILGELKKILEE